MTRYRKKPVVIDAIQWTGVNVQEVLGFLAEMVIKFKKPAQVTENSIIVEEVTKIQFDLTAKPHIRLTIATLNGDMAVDHGEFVLCGIQGEIYPCKADIFEATYDKVHPEYVEPEGPSPGFVPCTGCGHSYEDCDCNWSFDHEKAKQMIKEANARQYSNHELELAKLLEETLGFDLERRTYYNNFKLVQEDRHRKKEEIAKLRLLLIDALYIIDDCPEHPDKNQHTNAIEHLRLEVEKIKT
jgi:hypothetical protein